MATEPDLLALLPPAPPPRPNAREAAIGVAIRRFDGDATPILPPAPARRWRLADRPQYGALAAAALVAAIGLPLWLSGEHRPSPPRTEAAAPARLDLPAADTMVDLAAAPTEESVASRMSGIATRPTAPAAMVAPRAQPALRDAPASDFAAAPPPAAMVAPAPPPPPPPPPPAPAMTAAQEATADNDIVVTGSRIDARAEKARRRAERQALAQEALESARVAPKSSAAWLDRGLAYAKAGDDARALADLDKAIKSAPKDARIRYQRSLILRRLGQIERADADAARAAELDPRYRSGAE